MADLIALRDFLILCQSRSFSRAAEHCHVSVSGLSRRIQGLEQWIGAPLFNRHKTALELTDAGCRLQAVASEVVYALEGVRKSVRADSKELQCRIRFSAPHIMSAVFFPGWIPRLQGDFKDARLSVESHNLPECIARLEDGEADYVAALFDSRGAVATRLRMGPDFGGYLSLALGTEHLVPVCAPNAAGQPLFDLARNGFPVPFLDYADECHLGWSLQATLKDLGLPLQRQHDASLANGLHFMAASGLGVAWLPHALVREDLTARRLVRAGGPGLDIPLQLTLLRRSAPLMAQAQRLWDYLEVLTRNPLDEGEPASALTQ
ncbi:LysR family transcriptional regulator [Bordetella hinzii]|uniref:LysR family transcriptional regulator n=1 Tax=Bacteria TaxID=2 RepID=UPI0033FBA3D5|nr:LysR substrate-binding domain-containing protein [Bordetella hinzii]